MGANAGALIAVFDHTATLVHAYDADGKLITSVSRVIINGGCTAGAGGCTHALNHLLLLGVDPATDHWQLIALGLLNHFRGRHSATLLYAAPGPDVRRVKVLAAGGTGEGSLFSSEICGMDAGNCEDRGFSDTNQRQDHCVAHPVDPVTGEARRRARRFHQQHMDVQASAEALREPGKLGEDGARAGALRVREHHEGRPALDGGDVALLRPPRRGRDVFARSERVAGGERAAGDHRSNPEDARDPESHPHDGHD
jgi:hypothetical protein